MKWILSFVFIMNILTYCVYGIDKGRARSYKWRISETRLLLIAFLGGGIGAWRGMKDFHHKTQKNKFRFLVPLFIVLQVVFLTYLITKLTWNFLFVKWVGGFILVHLVLFYIFFRLSIRSRRNY